MGLRPLTRLIAKRGHSRRRRPPAWPHGQIPCEFPTLSTPLVDMRNADHRFIASTCHCTTCTRSWWRGCGPPGRSGEFSCPFPRTPLPSTIPTVFTASRKKIVRSHQAWSKNIEKEYCRPQEGHRPGDLDILEQDKRLNSTVDRSYANCQAHWFVDTIFGSSIRPSSSDILHQQSSQPVLQRSG